MFDAERQMARVALEGDQLLALAFDFVTSVCVDFVSFIRRAVIGKMQFHCLLLAHILRWHQRLTFLTNGYYFVPLPTFTAVVPFEFVMLGAENVFTGVAFNGQKVQLFAFFVAALKSDVRQLHVLRI